MATELRNEPKSALGDRRKEYGSQVTLAGERRVLPRELDRFAVCPAVSLRAL
jgi:hypothetical protein